MNSSGEVSIQSWPGLFGSAPSHPFLRSMSRSARPRASEVPMVLLCRKQPHPKHLCQRLEARSPRVPGEQPSCQQSHRDSLSAETWGEGSLTKTSPSKIRRGEGLPDSWQCRARPHLSPRSAPGAAAAGEDEVRFPVQTPASLVDFLTPLCATVLNLTMEATTESHSAFWGIKRHNIR